MKKEFKVISELIDSKSKVLDVGCGNGELMKLDRKSTRLNSSHVRTSRMPSSA